MSLIPKTPQEILEAYGAELEKIVGPNVLQDPIANRSSNLVRVLSMAALSLNDIEQAVEALIIEQNPNNLEGIALTNYGAQRGIQRKTGAKSKTIVMVTGQQGSILERGSVLNDRFGGRWITEADVILESTGVGCAFGMGIACAEESGTFCLQEDELVYDNSTSPFIFGATNGIMLEVGGAEESDEAFRNRILSRGPLANVNGTSDNALDAIYAIDGVNFARFEFVDTCIGSGPMFVVHGGDDAKICDELIRKSGVACNMVGESNCGSCNDVRFQRPCPVLLCIEVTVNPDCPLLTDAQISEIIMSVAPQIARQTKVRANDIAKLQQDIDSVRFRVKRQPLVSCPDDDTNGADILTDPIDFEQIRFGTQNPYGLCGGKPDCEAQTGFVNSASLNIWEYFVMDAAQITFVRSEQPESDCNLCED